MRNADSSWRDVRKQLRKDSRWDQAESLDREEKEKLFDEHMDELGKKNKEMFCKLLEETSGVRTILFLSARGLVGGGVWGHSFGIVKDSRKLH